MAFISTTETAGKERNKLCKEMVITIRELIKPGIQEEDMKDMAAFIAISLLRIHETIDLSVEAWEKRDYWIKAERFRQEWDWTKSAGLKIKQALINDDLPVLAMATADLAQRLSNIKVSEKHRMGMPWIGAFAKLK